MKTRLLISMLAVVLVTVATLYATSAQENTKLHPMTVAASCEGAIAGVGWLELTTDTADSSSTTAVFIDEAGNRHDTLGFGISGETMILIAGKEPITAGIELGAPLEVDSPPSECLTAEVQTETRELTQEDVDQYALDPAFIGETAEIETSITAIVWPAP